MKNLFKALANFQSEIKPIFKGNTGYGYRYSDMSDVLSAIKPILEKNGLSFMQPLDGDKLKTIIFHIESGENIESTINIPQNVILKGQNDFQVLGSAITYLRRYSLSSILGLVTDVDLDATGKHYSTIDEIKADYDNKLITQQQATKAKEQLKTK